MEPVFGVEPAGAESSRCAVHPDQFAVGVCERCGDFHCARCHKRVGGRVLCGSCRALPGIDYLDDTRRRFWGKRDGFVWYFGLFALFGALATLPMVLGARDLPRVVMTSLWIATAIAYLALQRQARVALVALCALDLFVDAVRAALGQSVSPFPQPLPQDQEGTMTAVAFGGGVFSLLLALGAYFSPRNKLAFRILLDERALQRVYDRYLSNPLAVRSAVYGSLGVFIPFLSVVTLVMGIRALRRADLRAWPPRGGAMAARIGVGISALGVLGWAAIMVRIAISLANR